MELPDGRPEPSLSEEVRSSALLFGLALGTTACTVAIAQLMVKVLS